MLQRSIGWPRSHVTIDFCMFPIHKSKQTMQIIQVQSFSQTLNTQKWYVVFYMYKCPKKMVLLSWLQDDRVKPLTLCLPHTNLPCATLFWGALELGRHFGSTIFNLWYIFTCKSYGKKTKSQINNACAQCEPKTMGIASLSNMNEQYVCEWLCKSSNVASLRTCRLANVANEELTVLWTSLYYFINVSKVPTSVLPLMQSLSGRLHHSNYPNNFVQPMLINLSLLK